MNLSSQKNLCTAISLLCLVATAVLLLHGLFGPIRVEPAQRASLSAVRSESANEKNAVAFSAFASVWNHPLQSPIFDALPETVQAELPTIHVRLMATIQESGEWKAMLKIPSGATLILARGDTFDNEPGQATILEIREKNIDIQFDGVAETIITLELGK